MKLRASVLAAILLGIPTFGASQTAAQRTADYAALPTPAPIKGILAVQRFTLQTPFEQINGNKDTATTSGALVVLDVNPAYAVPRDALEPLLYAGNVLVMRLNHGNLSGRVIGIVRGNVDISTAPIWFGAAELPERLTPEMVRAQRALADQAGITALPRARIAAVSRPAVAVKDLAALLRTTGANLVYEFSPQDKALANSWRQQVAKPPARMKIN